MHWVIRVNRPSCLIVLILYVLKWVRSGCPSIVAIVGLVDSGHMAYVHRHRDSYANWRSELCVLVTGDRFSPIPQIDIIGAMVVVWRVKLSGLFCAILFAAIVHSAMHTNMNRPSGSLDWVLSYRAHFTVLRFIFVYVYILFITVYCSIVTLWGEPGRIEAWSLGSLLLSVLWHC